MQFGYYGKSAQRPDYVRFNLPQTFVNVWDDWLQATLTEGELVHKKNWKSIYDTSPAFRFGLSAGIAGELAWVGIMWPSYDSHGGRFPLALALALPQGISPVAHASSLEPAYQILEALLHSVRDEELDFDSLRQTMTDISASGQLGLHFPESPQYRMADPRSNLAILAESPGTLTDQASTASLLNAVLQQTWFSFSVWQPLTLTQRKDTIQTLKPNQGQALSPPLHIQDANHYANHYERPVEKNCRDNNASTTLVSCGLPLPGTAVSLFDKAWQTRDYGRLQRTKQAASRPKPKQCCAPQKKNSVLKCLKLNIELTDPDCTDIEVPTHNPIGYQTTKYRSTAHGS